MTPQEFESLLNDADLNPHRASGPGIAFSVSHHAMTEIPRIDKTVVRSLRIQCEWLFYEPAEFANMTPAQANAEIAACKKRLERAAKTKQGQRA